MKLAIMQPYFMPYIGYFQLLKAVDKFVIYDNIQFSKRGWFNRNRILSNGTDKLFTLPIKKDSDYLNVCERYLSSSFRTDQKKILSTIEGAYKGAPYFSDVVPLIQKCMRFENNNLFEFIYNSLNIISEALSINTPIHISSKINIDHALKGKNKVVAICKKFGCTTYINTIGGVKLYSKKYFKNCGIELYFIKPLAITYTQFGNKFVPWLSIIDVMMFNSITKIDKYLDQYELV